MLEIREFDGSQTVLLRDTGNGKKSLVATLTGQDKDADAAVLARAYDLLECVEMFANFGSDNVPWWLSDCHKMAQELVKDKTWHQPRARQ